MVAFVICAAIAVGVLLLFEGIVVWEKRFRGWK